MSIRHAPSGTIRAALRHRGFRWLLAGMAVSQLGDWLYNVALIVLVYERTHSPMWAGITTAAGSSPSSWWARWAVSSPTSSTGEPS
jgi:hypothetical protein